MAFRKMKKAGMIKSAFASAMLIVLSSCTSQTAPSPKETKAAKPAISVLTDALPSPYNTYPKLAKGGACSIDRAPDQAENNVGVSGWAIIDAKKGDVPDKIILRVESKGSVKYAIPEQTIRSDVGTYFNNPKLSKSGFVQVLPVLKSERPATISALLVFNQGIYECPTNLVIPE